MIEQYEVLRAAIDQNPIEITKEDVCKIMQELAYVVSKIKEFYR